MDATELFQTGRLQDAIAAQVQEVRARPADQAKRLFLFELLAFSGDLDRARKQVEALSYDEPGLQNAAVAYRKLLDAEQERRKVFEEGIEPGFFGDPPAHLRTRLEAAGLIRLDRYDEAAALIREANDAVAHTSGRLNGKPFESLRDADDLFAGVLEVMAQGHYYWVGLEQVVSLAANPPRFPRDLLYLPARLELAEESGEVFLPVLYPSSFTHDNDQVKLGRMTEWNEVGGGIVMGQGAHDFFVDAEPIGLLECRELVLEDPANPGRELRAED